MIPQPNMADRETPELAPAEDLVFPEGFLWGVATSAHQVEGENYNNQWFAWENSGGIKSGDRCGRACGWWNDWSTDFDLARDLGVNALRLSVEWSRIEPRPGEWDESALARYRSMLEGLHQRGIRPMVTLHHFTHPLWFEREGAFLGPDAPAAFERFTRRVLGALAELCTEWVTFNEPNVHAAMGYALGQFPPGRTGNIPAAMRSLANMALAHARACRSIHELQPNAQVGWAHNFVVDGYPLHSGKRNCLRLSAAAYRNILGLPESSRHPPRGIQASQSQVAARSEHRLATASPVQRVFCSHHQGR